MQGISAACLFVATCLINYGTSQQQYGAPQQQQSQQQYLPQQPQQQYGAQQQQSQQQYSPQQQPQQPQQQYGTPSQQQPQPRHSYGPQQQQPQQQYSSQQPQQQQRRQIGADNESTMLIVAALCKPGALNEDVVNRFFGCYSQVKGTDIYLNCQHEAYGCILNTERTITTTCSGMGKFKVYMECLVSGFKKANVDLIPSATKLNQCMADVLGVGF